MRIDIGEEVAWTILGVSLLVTVVIGIGYGVESGKHEREQIIKATTCEQLAAMTGSFHANDILMCRNK